MKTLKIISIACIAAMALSLASCGNKKIDKSDVTTTTATTASSAEEAAVTDVTEPAPEETETATTTKKKEEKKEKPVKKENLNQLTGLYDVADSAKGKRPCAVMVNNIEASLPQYGIYSADILCEIVAEGGITRLMAIYADESDIPNVCSIRSARYYFLLLAQSFDAVYLHWGAEKKYCEPLFTEMGLDHINGMVNTNIFDRDYDRAAYMDLEHTGYLKGSGVMNEIENQGIRSSLKEGYDSIFKFYDEFTRPAGDECSKIVLNFSNWYTSQFDYSSKTKTYKKLHNGSKHMDVGVNKQLEFTNLLVLEVPEIKILNTKSNIVGIDIKSGSGYLFSGGKCKRINWSKEDDLSKIEITDTNGGSVKLNTGKTYIGVIQNGAVSMS